VVEHLPSEHKALNSNPHIARGSTRKGQECPSIFVSQKMSDLCLTPVLSVSLEEMGHTVHTHGSERPATLWGCPTVMWNIGTSCPKQMRSFQSGVLAGLGRDPQVCTRADSSRLSGTLRGVCAVTFSCKVCTLFT
jgi:hypothetical protein